MSAVAIPASLILAYLGINASQVNPNRSMFDHHYLGMYLIVAAVIVLGVRAVGGRVRSAAPRRPPPPPTPAEQPSVGPCP